MAHKHPKGTVYLLHFHRKLQHAEHYLGFSTKLEDRLQAHENGSGARLMEVLKDQGIGFRVVRVWRNETRSFERKLKNQKKSSRLCPICIERARKKAA